MSTEDSISLAVPVLFVVMLTIEALFPARTFPPVRFWRLVGVAALIVLITLSVAVQSALPLQWIAAHALLPGHRLGIAGGVVVGYLVLSLVSFAWHRTEHAVPFLWRWIHQLHHSPKRVDLSGGAYFHPFEVVTQVLINLAVTVFVLGLHPLAGALVGAVGAFYGMFQHWNIRTPRWLGYLIQRPESHCLHHEKGVHGRNYSDLPLWDLLFGSFHNPATFEGEAGFADGAEQKVGQMLIGRDVSTTVTTTTAAATAASPPPSFARAATSRPAA